MAGDWIKMRLDLAEDPAVIAMADEMGVREETVVGYCHALWCFVSRQSGDGIINGITLVALGRRLTLPGFPELMVKVGWLEYLEDGEIRQITVPHFDRHLSQSAKTRALASQKKRNQRRHVPVPPKPGQMSRKCPEKRGTREEKRREEKEKIQEPPIVPLSNGDEVGRENAFKIFWGAYPARHGKKLGREKTWKLFLELPASDWPLVSQAAGNYARSQVAAEGYAKDPSGFFEDGYWRDWLDGPGNRGRGESVAEHNLAVLNAMASEPAGED